MNIEQEMQNISQELIKLKEDYHPLFINETTKKILQLKARMLILLEEIQLNQPITIRLA